MTARFSTHLIITTHTPFGLRLTLRGAAHQSVRPTSITVTCDVRDESILRCAMDASREFQLPLTLIQRTHQGIARPAQTRNNAVRWLLASGLLESSRVPGRQMLVFLDGDCFAPTELVEMYHRLFNPHAVVIGGRIELNAAQTTAFEQCLETGQHQSGVMSGSTQLSFPLEIEPKQWQDVNRRNRRVTTQRWLRYLHLGKPHKPKIVAANFAICCDLFLNVNGFDEGFEGWGVEDDDLARRAYASGGVPVVAVNRAVVLHQFHPTRSRGNWNDNPAAQRFHARGPIRCIHGVVNPRPQDPPEFLRIAKSRLTVHTEDSVRSAADEPARSAT